MRILLKLEACKDFSYDSKYYSKFQGFIYRQLINTPYSFLHQKKGYKFFCFSNIFPLKPTKKGISPFKEGETKFWLISSPDKGFIFLLNEKFQNIAENNSTINLGEMQFYLKSVKIIKQRLKRKNVTLKLETPLILRAGKKTYKNYKIIPPREYKYLFWKKEYPLELFIDLLTKNLIKKYAEFYYLNDKISLKELESAVTPLFQRLEFEKTIVAHVPIKGREQKFIGSLWRFHFDWLNNQQKNLLEFAIDCGFGEKNSYGFGFVNVMGM